MRFHEGRPVRVRTKRTLTEAWQQAYRADPYAGHLTRPELAKRIRDIMLNLQLLTPDAKIGVVPADGHQTGIWWEKWTHVLTEMEMRYGPHPNGWARDILHPGPEPAFPDFTCELAGKAARRMAALNLKPGSLLIKFGERQFMERLVEQGALRIQPASFFSRPELNQAVGDDELSLPVSLLLSREQIVKLVANPEDVPLNALGQRVDIEFASRADFWLYCTTRSVEPRLFVDFGYDSCVIIRDPAKFAKRLRDAAREPTGNATAREGRANYVDPLLPKSPKIFIPFAKPFGYSYQKEYRFCWTPKQPAERLEHLDVELGSLADIAELVVLD